MGSSQALNYLQRYRACAYKPLAAFASVSTGNLSEQPSNGKGRTEEKTQFYRNFVAIRPLSYRCGGGRGAYRLLGCAVPERLCSDIFSSEIQST